MFSQRGNAAAVVLVLLASSLAVVGREKGAGVAADARMQSGQQHVSLDSPSLFAHMKWRTVGPSFQGGRIQSITLDGHHPGRFSLGVGSENVWRTDNNGVTWTPIFEHESTFTVGDVALSPADPNVIWVGSGEVLMARSSFAGTGVFKSVDGDKKWRNMGLAFTCSPA